MPVDLYLDIETFSPVPIEDGADAYATKSELLLVQYAEGDAPVTVIDCTEVRSWPTLLARQIKRTRDRGGKIVAHNAWFERTVLKHHGVPIGDAIGWHCTMAQALAHGFPASLDLLAKFLGLPPDLQKKDGQRLIRLFAKPQPRTGLRVRPADHPEHWERFKEYAERDVTTTREVRKRLPTINYRGFEHRLWALDQKINSRGVMVDSALAEAAIEACATQKKRLDAALSEVTLGAVTSATQRDRVMQALKSYGMELDDLRAATVAHAVSDEDIRAEVRVILEARQQVSLSSTAKYDRILKARGPGGRVRGVLQYCGADRTGRWAGRIIQPQNLPRPSVGPDEVRVIAQAIKEGTYDLLDDNVFRMCSDAIRSTIIAPPGKKLVVADYSAIEGRILAWLAKETWKLEAYANGGDLYVLTYNRMFGLPADAKISPDQRAVGKVLDLSMGYEGGVGALATMAEAYGVDLQDIGEAAWRNSPQHIKDRAMGLLRFAKERKALRGMDEELYAKLESAKLSWREASPKTSHLWKLYGQAALSAMASPGDTFQAGRCKFVYKARILAVTLPSGRMIMYAHPRVTDDGIIYRGSYGGMVGIYGGKFTENITQAVARDVLARGLVAADAAGFNIVLHIHDEIVAEEDETREGALDELLEAMCRPLSWARGLPLDGSGYESREYRKD